MRYSLAELNQVANWLLQKAAGFNLICFEAEMGTGKTTLIKAILQALGSGDTASSPSFGLVNEYKTKEGKPVYHFDFYRIKSPDEALDIGWFEYLDSGNLCLVEWPEKIEPLLLNEPYLKVQIDLENGNRLIQVQENGPKP